MSSAMFSFADSQNEGASTQRSEIASARRGTKVRSADETLRDIERVLKLVEHALQKTDVAALQSCIVAFTSIVAEACAALTLDNRGIWRLLAKIYGWDAEGFALEYVYGSIGPCATHLA